MPSLRSSILAIDVGATSIKASVVSPTGQIESDISRVMTPYPCPPAQLCAVLDAMISAHQCDRVAVGFPGDMENGTVLEPGNLSRRGGIGTDLDADITAAWVGFDLQSALQAKTAAQVKVVNDATLAAHGYFVGVGRELILTLGTGCGIALVVEGEWQRIRDVGAEIFDGRDSYDVLLGEPARRANLDQWRRDVIAATSGFALEFSATVVHWGGGNARWLRDVDAELVTCPIVFNDNEGTLRGAARLFSDLQSQSVVAEGTTLPTSGDKMGE